MWFLDIGRLEGPARKHMNSRASEQKSTWPRLNSPASKHRASMGFTRHSHVQKIDSASPMSWFACAVIYSTHAMSPAPALTLRSPAPRHLYYYLAQRPGRRISRLEYRFAYVDWGQPCGVFISALYLKRGNSDRSTGNPWYEVRSRSSLTASHTE